MLIVVLASAGCVGPQASPLVDDAGGLVPPAVIFTVPDGERLWEPMVAIDPTDPMHMVASSQRKFHDADGLTQSWGISHVTRDGGRTWQAFDLPGGPRGAAGDPLSDRTWMDDSVPAFLDDGTLLWSVLAMTVESDRQTYGTISGADLVVLRSTDGGETFSEVTVVEAGSGQDIILLAPTGARDIRTDSAQDKQWLQTDGQDAWMVWSDNRQQEPDCLPAGAACTFLRTSESHDGGHTWSEPGAITTAEVSGAFNLDLGGVRLVSYHSWRDDEVFVARDDGGWSSTSLGLATKFPMMAQSESGRVYIAYPRGDDRDALQDVAVRWSDDDGATWTEPSVLATPGTEGRTIPQVADGGGDRVWVTYWVPEEGGGRYEAVLFNGTVLERATIGNTTGGTWLTGDYMGLAPLPGGDAYAVWTAVDGDAYALHGARLRATMPSA